MEEHFQSKLLRRQLTEVLELNEKLVARIEQLKNYIIRTGFQVPTLESGFNAPIVEAETFDGNRSKRRRVDHDQEFYDASPVNGPAPYASDRSHSGNFSIHAFRGGLASLPNDNEYEYYREGRYREDGPVDDNSRVMNKTTKAGISPLGRNGSVLYSHGLPVNPTGSSRGSPYDEVPLNMGRSHSHSPVMPNFNDLTGLKRPDVSESHQILQEQMNTQLHSQPTTWDKNTTNNISSKRKSNVVDYGSEENGITSNNLTSKQSRDFATKTTSNSFVSSALAKHTSSITSDDNSEEGRVNNTQKMPINEESNEDNDMGQSGEDVETENAELQQRRVEEQRLEQERLEQERLERERLEQERLEQERLERERLEQERLEQERLERERLEQERLEQERLEQERLERERLEQERLEQERLEQERLEQERFERLERERLERLEQQRLEQERLEKERLEKERLEKERLEKERLEKERLEKERLEKERLEKERLEKERLEKELLEKERLEKERLEKERLEKERLEKERLEKERLEKERLEKERLAKERLEKERLEKERLEKERLEKERLEKEQLEKERERLEKERERLRREYQAKEREKVLLERERLEKERLEKERLEKERLQKESSQELPNNTPNMAAEDGQLVKESRNLRSRRANREPDTSSTPLKSTSAANVDKTSSSRAKVNSASSRSSQSPIRLHAADSPDVSSKNDLKDTGNPKAQSGHQTSVSSTPQKDNTDNSIMSSIISPIVVPLSISTIRQSSHIDLSTTGDLLSSDNGQNADDSTNSKSKLKRPFKYSTARINDLLEQGNPQSNSKRTSTSITSRSSAAQVSAGNASQSFSRNLTDTSLFYSAVDKSYSGIRTSSIDKTPRRTNDPAGINVQFSLKSSKTGDSTITANRSSASQRGNTTETPSRRLLDQSHASARRMRSTRPIFTGRTSAEDSVDLATLDSRIPRPVQPSVADKNERNTTKNDAPSRRKKVQRSVYEIKDVDVSLPDMSDMSVEAGDISQVRSRPKID